MKQKWRRQWDEDDIIIIWTHLSSCRRGWDQERTELQTRRTFIQDQWWVPIQNMEKTCDEWRHTRRRRVLGLVGPVDISAFIFCVLIGWWRSRSSSLSVLMNFELRRLFWGSLVVLQNQGQLASTPEPWILWFVVLAYVASQPIREQLNCHMVQIFYQPYKLISISPDYQ